MAQHDGSDESLGLGETPTKAGPTLGSELATVSRESVYNI